MTVKNTILKFRITQFKCFSLESKLCSVRVDNTYNAFIAAEFYLIITNMKNVRVKIIEMFANSCNPSDKNRLVLKLMVHIWYNNNFFREFSRAYCFAIFFSFFVKIYLWCTQICAISWIVDK